MIEDLSRLLDVIKNTLVKPKSELVTATPSDEPRDYGRDCIKEATIAEGEARAQTRLLLTHWSQIVAHSAEIVMPMVQLAHDLAGEEIRQVTNVKFIRPVQSELALHARFVRTHRLPARTENASVLLTCDSKYGQTIEVVATPLDQPIHGGTWTGHSNWRERSFHGPLAIQRDKIRPFGSTSDKDFKPVDIHRRDLRPHIFHGLSDHEVAGLAIDQGLHVLCTIPYIKTCMEGCHFVVVSQVKNFSLPTADRLSNGGMLHAMVLPQIVHGPSFSKVHTLVNFLDNYQQAAGGGEIVFTVCHDKAAGLKFRHELQHARWTK